MFLHALTLSLNTVGNMYWFNGLLSPFTYSQLSFKPSENNLANPFIHFLAFHRKLKHIFTQSPTISELSLSSLNYKFLFNAKSLQIHQLVAQPSAHFSL